MILKRVFDSTTSAKDVIAQTYLKQYNIDPNAKVLVCEDGTVAYSKQISFDQPYKGANMHFLLFSDKKPFGHLSVHQSDVSDFYDDQELTDHIWGLVEHGMYHAIDSIKDYLQGDQFDNGALKGTVKSTNGDEITIETTNDKDEKKDFVVNQQTGEIKTVSDCIHIVDENISMSQAFVEGLEQAAIDLDTIGIASIEIPSDVTDETAIDAAAAMVSEELPGFTPRFDITEEDGIRKLRIEL